MYSRKNGDYSKERNTIYITSGREGQSGLFKMEDFSVLWSYFDGTTPATTSLGTVWSLILRLLKL